MRLRHAPCRSHMLPLPAPAAPQTLPRLAEVLSSRELLLRCFEAAAEQDGEDE